MSHKQKNYAKLVQLSNKKHYYISLFSELNQCPVHLLPQNLVRAYSNFLSMLNFLCILKRANKKNKKLSMLKKFEYARTKF